jgi:hypothetical protein
MGTPWRVDQGSQQPVNEHQPMPSTGPDRPLPWLMGQTRVLARLPVQPRLDDQLSEDLRGQLRHSAISDSGGTGQRPGHRTTLPRPARSSRPANHAQGRKAAERGLLNLWSPLWGGSRCGEDYRAQGRDWGPPRRIRAQPADRHQLTL